MECKDNQNLKVKSLRILIESDRKILTGIKM